MTTVYKCLHKLNTWSIITIATIITVMHLSKFFPLPLPYAGKKFNHGVRAKPTYYAQILPSRTPQILIHYSYLFLYHHPLSLIIFLCIGDNNVISTPNDYYTSDSELDVASADFSSQSSHMKYSCLHGHLHYLNVWYFSLLTVYSSYIPIVSFYYSCIIMPSMNVP